MIGTFVSKVRIYIEGVKSSLSNFVVPPHHTFSPPHLRLSLSRKSHSDLRQGDMRLDKIALGETPKISLCQSNLPEVFEV